ncbi:glycosyltransferase family 4 protein [Shewanella rhizosphaerae]|uniref:glycosyltransferase family 4 protein n=1 Tax=Shewanella rhizosphaerae TaxID=2864207 RepID=UPI001C659C49|nr:glycosyltransferase family 4 protein [Shewanella rhizosphaerae]QYK14261.1 glycosyltransferase family 4 protein [Shewanella rhizosphaerae]
MKICFVTPLDPEGCEISGGLLKTSKLIHYLKQYHDVTLVSLTQEKKLVSGNKFYVSERHKKPSLLNLLKSYLLRKPVSVIRNYNSRLKSEISELLENVDVIVVDHFFMYQYIDRRFDNKTIYHAHNAEFLIWLRRAKLSNNFFAKIVLGFESIRVRNMELDILKRTRFFVAAPNDIQVIKELDDENLGFKFRETYHLGDDSLLNKPDLQYSSSSPAICFVGGLNWNPNYDGIKWFLDSSWSLILERLPTTVLHIVGSASKEQNEYLKTFPNVITHGFVSDIDSVLSKCTAFVCPLKYGSGMKVKNITALYRGFPIVTTSVGAEGINIRDGFTGFIADTEELFANRVLEILESQSIFETMSYNARELGCSQYSWAATLNKFGAVLNEL